MAIVSMLLCVDLVSAEQPKVPVNVGVFPQEMRTFHTEADGLPSNDVRAVALAKGGRVAVRTAKGDAGLASGKWSATDEFAAKKSVPAGMHGLVKNAGAG